MEPNQRQTHPSEQHHQRSIAASVASGSSLSIMSDKFVKYRAKEEIKQSVSRSIDKTVTLWTPVVTFKSHIQPVKRNVISYNSG